MQTPNSPLPPQKGFTIRAAIIAVALSLFLLFSSSYVAIRIGAMPWPIVFSVIVAGGALRMLSKRVNIHEVNIAQAGASVGGLVASGIVFTLPGIIYLNQTQNAGIAWPEPLRLAALTAMAGVLGVALSIPLKRTFIDEEDLPYPAGTAGAELLLLGKSGGHMLTTIVLIGALAGIFALLRDVYFPAGVALTAAATVGIVLSFIPLPIAAAGGFILGPAAGFSWLLGAIIGWLVVVPLLFAASSELGEATGMIQHFGMGMVLGSGLGFLSTYAVPRFKKIFLPLLQWNQRYTRHLPLLSLAAIIVLVLGEVPLLAAVLTVLGVWSMVAVAARMTGETNIDPLEQFGIFVGLVIALVFALANLSLSMQASFIIVAFVSVACAVAGDIGHDYKSAHIVGTDFWDIVKVDMIAVIAAGLAAPLVLYMIQAGFADQLFTPSMPAPQARLVAGSISGFQYPWIFVSGLAAAFIWEFVNLALPLKFRNKLLIMPFGIGMFLGLGLAIPLALGAAVRVVIDRRAPHRYQTGLLVSAGVMGGEGIAGFSAGALTALGISYATGASWLIGVLVIIALVTALMAFGKRDGLKL